MSDVPDLAEHLVAGRRAAYTAVLIASRQMDNATMSGDTDEQYKGGHISINGLDIGPAIDAAVLETLVRCNVPHVTIGVQRRSRWKRLSSWAYEHRAGLWISVGVVCYWALHLGLYYHG